MKKNNLLETIIEEIKRAESIALFTHSRPDGDALGSVLSLKFALESLGKTADAFCDTVIGHKYTAMGYEKFFSTRPKKNYDLFIALDCGDSGRLGGLGGEFLSHKNTMCIDHHFSHVSFCRWNYVIDCSSTCEIIFELIHILGIEIDEKTAVALYVGISTDTGNFSHSNTTPAVFKIAACLASKGIDIAGIYDKVYASSRFERTRLLGIVLSRVRQYYDGRLCLIYITRDDFLRTDTAKDDTEGFIDCVINIEGAEIGVSVCEHSENVYKVSMRSKGLNVAEVCAHFGGGGHLQAAGCMISGLFEDVVEKILKAVGDFIWTDL